MAQDIGGEPVYTEKIYIIASRSSRLAIRVRRAQITITAGEVRIYILTRYNS